MKKHLHGWPAIRSLGEGWATLEFVLLIPFFILLITTLFVFGELYRKQLDFQFYTYSVGNAISEFNSDKYPEFKIDSINCKAVAIAIIGDTKLVMHDGSVACDVDNNVLTIRLSKRVKFAKIPFFSGLSKELKAESYVYVR